MSTTLGKRKREVVVATRHRRRSSSDDGDDQHNAIPPETERDIFKKYFESTFEPLPESPTVLPPPSDEDEGEDDDGSDDPSSREDEDWEGLSGSEHEEGPTTVEVVEHWKATNDSEDAEFRRLQYKTFMVSHCGRKSKRRMLTRWIEFETSQGSGADYKEKAQTTTRGGRSV